MGDLDEELKREEEKLCLANKLTDLEQERVKELKSKLSHLEEIKKNDEHLIEEYECLSVKSAELQQELEGLRKHGDAIENEKQNLLTSLEQVFILSYFSSVIK